MQYAFADDHSKVDPRDEGWEFICLISALIKRRMYEAFLQTQLFVVWDLNSLLEDLAAVWRYTDVKSSGKMSCDNPCWNYLTAAA